MKALALSIFAVFCLQPRLWAGPCARTSQIFLTGSRQTANGQSRVTARVSLRDETGLPLSGKNVRLQTDNTAFILLQPEFTDASGSATGYILSHAPGSGALWALADGVRLSPNLLRNPSAEAGDILPDDWQTYSNQDLGAGSQFLWEAHSGSGTARSLGSRIGRDPFSELLWIQSLGHPDLAPGTTFTVRALIRAGTDFMPSPSPSGVFLSAAALDGDGLPLQVQQKEFFPPHGDWKEAVFPGRIVPPGTDRLEISLENLRNQGSLYFDDVSLTLEPDLLFRKDSLPPAPITRDSPTFLSVRPGSLQGEIEAAWKAVGNDGLLWPNPQGSYEIRVTSRPALPVSSWTLAACPLSPAAPGSGEKIILKGLAADATYQIAVRAVDENGNKPAFGISSPVQPYRDESSVPFLSLDPSLREKSFLDARPLFHGRARPGTAVKVAVDGRMEGETLSDFSGTWRFQTKTTLSEGAHWALFRALDAFNGSSGPAVEISFRVDKTQGQFRLNAPYPNPLRLSQGQKLQLHFSLASFAKTRLAIFDSYGRKIADLLDRDCGPGAYHLTWDGKMETNEEAASGSYLVILETDREKETARFTLLR